MRTVRRFLSASTTVIAVIVLAACARDADTSEHFRRDAAMRGNAPRPAARPTAEAESAARAAINAYLEASREGSSSRAALDTLALCDGDASPQFPSALLASWAVHSFEARGDTVVVRARVLTVAEQDIDRRGGGFVARLRVRSDELEWDIYQQPEGHWVVCNGLRFGYIGADSLTEWRPEGASYARAVSLADSIRRAVSGAK